MRVTPDPQLATIGCQRSTSASLNTFSISAGDLQCAVLIEYSRRKAGYARRGCARDANPGRGSGAFPANRSGRASIDDLRGTIVLDAALHVGDVAHESSVPPRGEMARGAAARLAALQRPALALPFRQPAIQHGHVLDAHDAERPPHPRRAENSGRRRPRCATRRRSPCCACARRTSPGGAACAGGCSWCRQSRRYRRRSRPEYAPRDIRRRAFLPSPGMCQEASMMTRSGASSSAASSSVSVNHVFAERSISQS